VKNWRENWKIIVHATKRNVDTKKRDRKKKEKRNNIITVTERRS